MGDREVFPNAPLALVAAEVRYPAVAERPIGMLVQRGIRDELGSDWVIHNDTTQTFEAGVSETGPQASLRSETIRRITSRLRTKIITVQESNFTIEVADYVNFEHFRDLVGRVSEAVEKWVEPDGILRVGLRYIDEITVPEPTPDWARWLDPALLAPTLPSGNPPRKWTGAVQYQVAGGQVLVLRYGPSENPVVSPVGPLRRPRVPEGPIFMLDFDSSWQPDDIPEFRADRIVTIAQRLHSPLRGLFDSLIQPRLLEFFRKDLRR